ncbi:MAG: PEP-CTERM sorting domain-containing protein, partial [Okeania sp. SIO3C4]|nr:PEP-CTERM sorting domain-containing protein [Okeania sp. SIO3C4]
LTLNSSENQSVPEPTSILSLIALGVLGFGSRLLKQKLPNN